jgi:hypothetical protein
MEVVQLLMAMLAATWPALVIVVRLVEVLTA